MKTLDSIVSILTHNNRAEISIARKNMWALYSQNKFTKYSSRRLTREAFCIRAKQRIAPLLERS
jgi:hypothetical protein